MNDFMSDLICKAQCAEIHTSSSLQPNHLLETILNQQLCGSVIRPKVHAFQKIGHTSKCGSTVGKTAKNLGMPPLLNKPTKTPIVRKVVMPVRYRSSSVRNSVKIASID